MSVCREYVEEEVNQYWVLSVYKEMGSMLRMMCQKTEELKIIENSKDRWLVLIFFSILLWNFYKDIWDY
jgi:hypothetical protein